MQKDQLRKDREERRLKIKSNDQHLRLIHSKQLEEQHQQPFNSISQIQQHQQTRRRNGSSNNNKEDYRKTQFHDNLIERIDESKQGNIAFLLHSIK